jgi:chorismate mutase / prephenate dehydratase
MDARNVADSLDDLREEIDRIDTALYDLFVQRVEVVRRIGALKGTEGVGQPAMRPAREAQVLRRLIARAGATPGDGRLPKAALVRIWRELFAAMTRLQGPLAVAVYAPPESPGYRDLARDHFGSFTPMIPVTRAGQALHAVGTGTATVAVLPLPEDGGAPNGDPPWWLALFQGGDERLRVAARLPFGAPGFGYGADVRALAVGRFEHEPSGDDATVLAVEAAAGLSRGRLGALLKEADLPSGWSAAWRPPGGQGAPAFHLVEVGGFVPEGEARLGRLLQAARGEVLRAVPVGGYARPLTAEELA